MLVERLLRMSAMPGSVIGVRQLVIVDVFVQLALPRRTSSES